MSLRFQSIEALQAAIASEPGAIADLVAEALSGLDSTGRALHAVAHLATDDARARASALVTEARRGGVASPLFGIPVAHKDLYMRAGWPCGGGSKLFARHRADRTAFAVARLDQAGAVDCARLTSVELGLGTTGHNAYAGTPLNPWNRSHICGGSSSGSGAAVAAGLVPASLGSDTGGSVRLPAAACGLVGVKPTHGLIGRSGVIALSPTLDTLGPLTRTVRDAALVLNAIAGADDDDNDTSSIRFDPPDYLADIEAGIDGLRIGWPRNHFLEDADAPVADQVAGVFALAGRLGAQRVDVEVPGIETANAMTMLIIAVEGAALHERAVLESHELFNPQSLGRLLVGMFVPARDYHNAMANRGHVARQVLNETFSRVDVLVTPVWPYLLPTIAESDLGAGPGAATMVLRSGHNTRPVNYLGFPAVTVPTGFDANGLPMSVQLIGAPFSEARLLRVARALERELDFWSARPRLDQVDQ